MTRWRRQSSATALLAALLVLAGAGGAQAAPSDYQQFTAKLVGSARAGSTAKPRAVGLLLRPFQEVGMAGGPDNLGGLNSGALLASPPFATVYANLWLPRQLRFNLASFPGCAEGVILGQPSACPRGSEVGLANRDEECSTPGHDPCTVYAAGVVRAQGAQAGQYLFDVTLSVRIFVMNRYAGRRVHDYLALRVLSPLTQNVVIPGRLQKLTGAQAKRYGWRMRFAIPPGLISPAPGLVAQLSDFSAGLRAVSRSGKALAGLTSCPAGRTLRFGYSGEYNLDGQATAAGDFPVDEVGAPVESLVRCRP